MTLTLTLPGLGKPETVKDAVISILAKEWPLSTKRLHNDVRALGITATYQAVHKALRELEKDKVIRRTGKDYRIDEKWVETILKFGEEAKKAYSNSSSSNGKSGDVTNLTFNSMYEVDCFLTDFAKNEDFKSGSPLCIHWNHYWMPLFLDRDIYKSLKELASITEVYSVTPSNTAVDRWCYDFWKKTALRPKIVPKSPSTDFVVYEDTVIQIFYPEFLVKELDRIYSSAKRIEDLDIDELFDKVFLRKTIIPVTVNKNPVLAEQLRKQVMGYFKVKA